MIEVNNNLIQATSSDVVYLLRDELAERGIKRFATIKENGDNVQTNCPFHKGGQERKPSFGVNATKNKCHCFACGWSGSIEKFVSECFGYPHDNGKYGEQWLARNFSSIEIESRKLITFDRKANLRSAVTRQVVSEEELASYRYIHEYMYERKLTDAIIELFDIGYDSKTDCLTFPIRDIEGNCLFVARRSVKTKFFNYPEEIEKPVYGLYELNKIFPAYKNMFWNEEHKRERYMPDIIVCESMIDALTCWVYGKYAVALNGTGNDLQFKQLSELTCRKLILATDNDEAGIKARDRIRRNVKNKVITEYDVTTYPEGAKDINDMSMEEFLSLRQIF